MKAGLNSLLCMLCLSSAVTSADDGLTDANATEWSFAGHLKYQFLALTYPEQSIFGDVLANTAIDNKLETRLLFSASRDQWDFTADYQFINIWSDTLPLTARLPNSSLPVNSVINDDRRWWNLTNSQGNDDKYAMINRLDRLNIGFTTESTAWRFGRQAISWGNGMIFTPMDVFNPFDPASVDKEYKTGDDMLYGQYLSANGNDLQGVAIVRRDPFNGKVETDQSSLAFKYHGFIGMNEFDLLAAQHYGDQIAGIGGIAAAGSALWRGDVTWTNTDLESVLSLATSLSWSWTWGGKNVSGMVEYYYSGFGQPDGAYSVADLARNPDLVKRLNRGELFTLARNYLALSMSVEMTPMIFFSPNFFINLDDPSCLAQWVINYDWQQDLQVLAAFNFPIGPNGTEYGGPVAPVAGQYFSTGPSLFLQLAWYF